jgi:hypothetical protein
MKKFTKGTLLSIVDDNDRRIPGYLANGWKEEKNESKVPTKRAEMLEQALTDANESEIQKGGKKGKAVATDKKVNAAIKSKATAAAEGEEIDDGLTKKRGSR